MKGLLLCEHSKSSSLRLDNSVSDMKFKVVKGLNKNDKNAKRIQKNK